MAVVVQQIVDCGSAGVGFSITSISGQLGKIANHSNFGLGESVVSGEGEVGRWLIVKSPRKIRSASSGRKLLKVMITDP